MEKSTETELTGRILPPGTFFQHPFNKTVEQWTDAKDCTPCSLPLMANNGAGLAIAVTTYLDDVSRQARKKNEGTPSEETKEEVRSNFGWLPRVPNVTKNLKNAFELWDAVGPLPSIYPNEEEK